MYDGIYRVRFLRLRASEQSGRFDCERRIGGVFALQGRVVDFWSPMSSELAI
jgi:hypothetical protein